MTKNFPIPGVNHGNRIMVSALEQRAATDPQSSWVAVPLDDTDLSKGYKEITFAQFNNAVNHAVHWLQENLPTVGGSFQAFAYAGPKDLRYPILAAAAGKLQKVMVLPSPLITPEAQQLILEKTQCRVYIRPSSMRAPVGAILRDILDVQQIDAPDLEDLLRETPSKPYIYPKSWDEGKEDPWLVFHTSGTTGHPKPVTYTHQMMAIFDAAASLSDMEGNSTYLAAGRRWYTPLPSLHAVGTIFVLIMTTYLHLTIVTGPSSPPSPKIVKGIIKYGRVQCALLTPGLIDEICSDPSALSVLRNLELLYYAGAPLSKRSGDLLASHVYLAPAIGSTEVGTYWTKVCQKEEDWDYVEFQRHAGVVMEPRSDGLYELVFVRQPECKLQSIFFLYPDRDRFETNDLWVEHPNQKGLWKIVGRTDDYIYLSHGDGMHASSLEPELEQHPKVKAALIGGHGRSSPVLLIELHDAEGIESVTHRQSMIESLQPYIDKINEKCHECVRLAPERVLFATRDKPLIRTIKGNVARLPSLRLYEPEIATLFN